MNKVLVWLKLASLSISIALFLDPSANAEEPDLKKISNIVVVYLENHSFDNLLGAFPGANGLAGATLSPKQNDIQGTIYKSLPPVQGPFDVAGNAPGLRAFAPGEMPNRAFAIDALDPTVTIATVTRGLTHLFYTNRAQIHGGANDRFAALSDAGGLVMGYYSAAAMDQTNLWKAARGGVLFDNFFQGAFGGSFLNHIWLVCSCAPVWPKPPNDQRTVIGSDEIPSHEGRVTSERDGDYAVNTVQSVFLNNGAQGANLLPAQTSVTIGDRLSEKGIDWAWYSEGWDLVMNRNRTPEQEKQLKRLRFSYHHQPFAYFERFDPSTARGKAERRIHLRDASELDGDILSGQLPPVVFYKPADLNSEHPGFGSVAAGDAAVGRVIDVLNRSPIRSSYALIITYDEFGGFYDHVPPPKEPAAGERADFFGPGTRIPAILVSPLVSPGRVDSTEYETTSLIKLIVDRFGLDPLPTSRFKAVNSLAEIFRGNQN